MLPQGWVETTLGQIAAFNPKHTSDLSLESNVSFVPMSAVDEYSGKIVDSVPRKYKEVSKGYTHFSDGDVIFAKITPCMENGKAAIAQSLVNGVACGSTEFFVFRPEGIEATLLWYYLRQTSFRKDAERHMTGAVGQRRVTRAFLEKRSIKLPPLAEQRRIVAKLDSLTARIARARAELERGLVLTQKMRQSVLAYVFSGALSETATQITKTSSHPAHWNMIPLGELGEIQGGIQVGKKRRPESVLLETPYIRVANVQRGWLNLSEIKTLKATESEIKRLILKDGDILMNEGGDRDKLGRGWVWKGQIPNCIHQNHVFRIRLANPEFPPEFISHYANEFGQTYFVDQGTQTTNLASISKRKVAALPVPIPPTYEARRIVQIINTTFTHADRLETETQRALTLLDRLESSLLVKAFRGELVPQDPNDEPASVLLDRIRAERAADPKPKRGRKQSTLDMPLPRKRQTEKHD